MKWVVTVLEDVAGISGTYLPIKTAISLFMVACDQVPVMLPNMQNKKSLTLRWLSFSRWGTEHLSFFLLLYPRPILYLWICSTCNHARVAKIHDQQWLRLCWDSFSGCRKVHVSICYDHQGGQSIENIPWRTNVNYTRSTVAYLNVTIIVTLDTQNRRFSHRSSSKPGQIHGLTCTHPDLASQASTGRVVGWVGNRADPFL